MSLAFKESKYNGDRATETAWNLVTAMMKPALAKSGALHEEVPGLRKSGKQERQSWAQTQSRAPSCVAACREYVQQHLWH